MIEANRHGKREQIIDAAKQVLARDGLAACTTRSVAQASPLTKSAVHYYFDDIHQIVDLAMRDHVTTMIALLRTAAETESDPAEKLWAVVSAYLATFAEQPNAAFLWFEYWVDTGRRQSTDTVAATLNDVHALLSDLACELPIDDPQATTRTLVSWLLGTVIQQQVRPTTPEVLREELNTILRGSID